MKEKKEQQSKKSTAKETNTKNRMNKKQFAIVLVAVILLNLLLFGGQYFICSQEADKSEVLEKIENADRILITVPVEVPPSDPAEAAELTAFYGKFVGCFRNNDIDTFNSLLHNGYYRMALMSPTHRASGGTSWLPSRYDNGELYFENGWLCRRYFPEGYPVEEYETVLGMSLFGEYPVAYRDAYSKSGLLETIDWISPDIDDEQQMNYINDHFNEIFSQLVWTIEATAIPGDDASINACWSICKIPNDTYLMSNCISWYDEDNMCRTMNGYVFIIKRIEGELKMVAFLDVT